MDAPTFSPGSHGIQFISNIATSSHTNPRKLGQNPGSLSLFLPPPPAVRSPIAMPLPCSSPLVVSHTSSASTSQPPLPAADERKGGPPIREEPPSTRATVEMMVLKGTMRGHSNMVTEIAAPMDNYDIIISTSSGSFVKPSSLYYLPTLFSFR